ncbi:unnamed protein product [Closterium sp. NIES-53]
MAHFFPASDPAIERHFAMLDAAAGSVCQDEEAWENAGREGIRSSHGHYFRDVEPRASESTRKELREGIRSSHGGSYFRDIDWRAAPTTDRASESAHGGVRSRSESARNRWPIGGSFALGSSGATSHGGASKSPLQAYRAAVYQAHGASSDMGGARTSISSATPQSSTADVAGVAEPPSVRRSSTCTALSAVGSSRESPTSPLLFVAGRSPSEASSSSSEFIPNDMSSAGTEFKGRINVGDCAVKVVGGANPAAVEMYFKRKAQERARAAAPAARPAVGLPAAVCN